MDTESGGTGTTPAAPAPHEQVSSRASSALAALSILVILLYLMWRFIWQCRKHGARSNSTGAGAGASTVSPPTSSAWPPSCPAPRDATAAHGPPRTTTATTMSPLSVLVPVAAARFVGADKQVDCAVCLAELGSDDGEAAARLVPSCGHGFHAECIEAWFRVNSTCPLCRSAVGQRAGEAPKYDSNV